MTIDKATLNTYLSTLSPAKAEEFKKLPPEEQQKKINIFLGKDAPTSTKAPTTSKKQPIPMTNGAPTDEIGDSVSFSSKKQTSVGTQDTTSNEPPVPTYPKSQEKYVKHNLKNIDKGLKGFYDTAQNVQIAIDRALEGDLFLPETREFLIHKLQEKMKEFPPEEVAAATNPERRAQLSAARQINSQIYNQLYDAYREAESAITKGTKKAGVLDHLGHGIKTLLLGQDTRETAYNRLMTMRDKLTELNGLKYKLTAEEFVAKYKEITGNDFDFQSLIQDFEAGEATIFESTVSHVANENSDIFRKQATDTNDAAIVFAKTTDQYTDYNIHNNTFMNMCLSVAGITVAQDINNAAQDDDSKIEQSSIDSPTNTNTTKTLNSLPKDKKFNDTEI